MYYYLEVYTLIAFAEICIASNRTFELPEICTVVQKHLLYLGGMHRTFPFDV